MGGLGKIKLTVRGWLTRAHVRLGYLSRNQVLERINTTAGQLPNNLQEEYRLLLVGKGLILADFSRVPIPHLSPLHLSKATRPAHMSALEIEFDTLPNVVAWREAQAAVQLAEVARPEISTTVDETLHPLTIRAIMLGSDHPMVPPEIAALLDCAEHVDQLPGILDQLEKERHIIQTIDGEYFWDGHHPVTAAPLVAAGKVIPLYGSTLYVSQATLPKHLKTGRLVAVLAQNGQTYYCERTLAETWLAEHQLRPILGVGETIECYCLPEAVGKNHQNRKLLYGIDQAGREVLISRTPAAINSHRQEIVNFIAQGIVGSLLDQEKLTAPQVEQYYQQLQSTIALVAKQIHTNTPLQLTYMARRLAAMGGDKLSVIAGLLANLPQAKAEKLVDEIPDLSPADCLYVKEVLTDFYTSRAMIFQLNDDDHHYLQNFVWLLYYHNRHPASLMLLLASKIRDLKYSPATVATDEIRYLYAAAIAERAGFNQEAEDIKNLLFRTEQPAKYREYQERIDTYLGMSRLESKVYLAEKAVQLKRELVAAGIPAEAIQIVWRRKSEATVCEKIELRGRGNLAELPDILGMKVIIHAPGVAADMQEGEDRRLLDLADAYLKAKLQPAANQRVDDVSHRRLTGWQAISYKFLAPFGDDHKVEVQLMTKKMYENEKFLQIRQAHWTYTINRVFRGQRFDAYPIALLDRLTGNFAADYQLIRNYLINNWVFVFYVQASRKPGHLSAANLTKALRTGRVHLTMKRLPKGGTSVDLAAAQVLPNGQSQLEHFGGTQVFKFGLDEHGQAIVENVGKQGGVLPHYGVDRRLISGEIVSVAWADQPFDQKIRPIAEAQNHAKRPSALVTLMRLKEQLMGQALYTNEETGGRQTLERMEITLTQLDLIKGSYKFKRIEDLYLAVGADLIDLPEIPELIHPLQIVLTVGAGGRWLQIKSPDRKGLTAAILESLPDDCRVLSLSSTDYYLFGEKKVAYQLRLGQSETIHQKRVELVLQQFLATYVERSFPPNTESIPIMVKPDEQGWMIAELLRTIADHRLNVTSINLPEIGRGQPAAGLIEVEVPAEVLQDEDLLGILRDALAESGGVMAAN